MRRLTPLSEDSLEHYLTIARAKNEPYRTRLLSHSSEIGRFYTEYSTNTAALELIQEQALPLEQKNDFLHAYESETIALGDLKALVKRRVFECDPHALEVCQYCGITSSRTFDHYLPKRRFSQYAVCSLNLVPCCTVCNHLKGEAWLKEGVRSILSLYYDIMPTTIFLNATVGMASDVPFADFSLSEESASYGVLEKTIKEHFRILQLLQRYKEESAGVFSELVPPIAREVRRFGINAASSALIEDADALAGTRSVNDWKVRLKTAMGCSVPFLEWCGEQ